MVETSKRSVLVVEDNQYTLQALTRCLQSGGYHVHQATSAREGISIAKTRVPDVILADIYMPEWSGLDLLERLRSEPQTAHIPMVVMSSISEYEEIRNIMNLGADDYLLKPIQSDVLLQTIHARIQRNSMIEKQIKNSVKIIRNNLGVILPHEFRTPLTAIIGGMKVLKTMSDLLTAQEAAEVVDIVHDSAGRLQHLVEDILLYSKLESLLSDPEDVRELQSQSIADIREVISDSAYTVTHRHHRKTNLHIVAPNCEVPAMITELYLNILIQELIDNACKFSPTESSIFLAIQMNDDECIIIVRDEGRGMSEEQLYQLDDFIQFDRKRYEQQGIGIGLAIISKIVTLFQGRLFVSSIVGEGTVVKVILPSYQQCSQ